MYSALSTLNTTTDVPLSKAPNPQLLPGCRSINGCPLLRVCVCSLLCVCTLDGSNAEHKFWVWVTILGRMSLHFHFHKYNCEYCVTVLQFHSFKQLKSTLPAHFPQCMFDRCPGLDSPSPISYLPVSNATPERISRITGYGFHAGFEASLQ